MLSGLLAASTGLTGTVAAATSVNRAAEVPLASLLRADGTLKTGFYNGSVDPKGWQLTSAADGSPRFVPTGPQVAGDEKWDSRFILPGLDGQVFALIVSGSDIYVAGSFAHAGSLAAANIARWDGTAWHTLGAGTDGPIYGLALDGSQLYAGGHFAHAGAGVAKNVAVWNGTAWAALGAGTDGVVHALAVVGSSVYAGGEFTHAGGVAAAHVARWNNSAWQPLGTGTSDVVLTFAVMGSDLYVGGLFADAGSVPNCRVARWDGSAWHSLDGGVHNYNSSSSLLWVNSIAVVGANVYVGGSFDDAGAALPVSNVARWDGSAWHGVVPAASSVNVTKLLVSGADLYVAGIYNLPDDEPTENIRRWDGSAWHPLGSGTNGATYATVRTMALQGNRLLVGGDFNILDGQGVGYLGAWDGTHWHAFGNEPAQGLSSSILALGGSGQDLYAGGEFKSAGAVAAHGIAHLNGSSWSALGSGIDGTVSAIAISGTTVYASGTFTQAGGVAANNIARWDGAAWHALGSGANDTVRALVISGTLLYAGGDFSSIGGVATNGIGSWDGTAWHALGGGMEDGSQVQALAIRGADLYVGGRFYSAGALDVSNLARWNGADWFDVGGGVSEQFGQAGTQIKALVVHDNDLYVGGWFDTAGTTAANSIARWDGAAWHALGGGVTAADQYLPLWALAFDAAGTLYASGELTNAGGHAIKYIAQWNGHDWQALGSGVNGNVYALWSGGPDLYAGGDFTTAGGKPSFYLGLYHAAGKATATPTASSTATTTATGTATAVSSATAVATTTALPFSDVPASAYYYQPVQYLVAHGAISGYDSIPPCDLGAAHCFKPFNSTTRSQMVKIIVVAAGITINTAGGPHFNDVTAANPFYNYIETAANRGIVGGYTDGGFHPFANVTRSQLAKIVVLALGWTPVHPPSASFRDVARDNPFYSYVETAVTHQIISGYDCGAGCHEFRPANAAVRAQIAKIVYLAVTQP